MSDELPTHINGIRMVWVDRLLPPGPRKRRPRKPAQKPTPRKGGRMTDSELAAAFAELRTLCTTIIGFHIEAERESSDLGPAARVMAEAQVYAGGVALAHRVLRIGEELERRAED